MRYVPCLLNFVRKGGFHENSPTSDANLVHSCMNLMDCQLSDIAEPAQISGTKPEQITAWIEVSEIVHFSIMRGEVAPAKKQHAAKIILSLIPYRSVKYG